jgi:hypothetical protein
VAFKNGRRQRRQTVSATDGQLLRLAQETPRSSHSGVNEKREEDKTDEKQNRLSSAAAA